MRTPSTTAARPRSRSRRRPGALLVALALVVACASCSSEAPQPLPSSAVPTLSDSPTPTTSPPAKPVAAKTKAGAEDFVSYFWRVRNHAFLSGDPSLLSEISHQNCIFCASIVKQVDQLKMNGRVVNGGAMNVTTVVSSPPGSGDSVIVATFLQQDSGEVRDSTGSVVSTLKRSDLYESFVRLEWNGTTWQMGEVDFTEKIQ